MDKIKIFILHYADYLLIIHMKQNHSRNHYFKNHANKTNMKIFVIKYLKWNFYKYIGKNYLAFYIVPNCLIHTDFEINKTFLTELSVPNRWTDGPIKIVERRRFYKPITNYSCTIYLC